MKTTMAPTTLKNKLVALTLALALAGSSLGTAFGVPTTALADETAGEETVAAGTSADASAKPDPAAADAPAKAEAEAVSDDASATEAEAEPATQPADAAETSANAANTPSAAEPETPAAKPDATDGPASTLKMATPDLPLASKANLPTPSSDDEANHTMTFYYCEMVHYDDPEWIPHPSGNRLLYTRVVENLKVGDQLNTWDYVDVIDGYFFFDAIPARPVVSANEDENYVELRYANPELNKYTVNYYRVSDGDDCTEGDGGPIVEELGGEQVAFECFKSETVDQQRFNLLVDGEKIAQPVDDMMYVDSFPESIRVTTRPEDNVINLLYTDTMTTLPDDAEVIEGGTGSGPDSDSGGNNGSGNDTGTGDGAEDDAGTGDGSAPSQPEGTPTPNPDAGSNDGADQGTTNTPEAGAAPGTTDALGSDSAGTSPDSPDSPSTSNPADDGTEAAPQPERPVGDGTLPQTGDPLAATAGLAALAALAATGIIAVARRQS